MEFLQLKDIKKRLLQSLTNAHFTKHDNLSPALLDKHINSPQFLYALQEILSSGEIKASEVLTLCTPLLTELWNHGPENWLEYIYSYALSKNFKEAININLNPDFNLSCEVYLKIFKILCDIEKTLSNDLNWQSKYPIILLTEEDINELEYKEEYVKFLRAFNNGYVYEMMKLNGELFKFNTLDHICGVHYLSMFLARQLKAKGIPIDLGRVSGAAAGHDIGKYGCKGEELKKVPHYHYYYTDHWFKNHGINYIRNIAINHSTWDLELENLSLESLILIYCDFRVKNSSPDNKMTIFSLEDSFQVILDKLENVDSKKENRYKRVYTKLLDFEMYLHSINVTTNPDKSPNYLSTLEVPSYSLIHGNELIRTMKNLTISHNINLMYILRDEYSLNAILEQARSEMNFKNLRQYINVLDEYCTYFTQKQKLQTINFLYETLTHSDEDIRRYSAYLIGRLIAIFDEVYRKELPESASLEMPSITSFSLFDEYLNLMLHPSSKLIPAHKTWIGYNTKTMVKSLFNNSRYGLLNSYRSIILKHYQGENLTFDTQLYLLDTAKFISFENSNLEVLPIIEFILRLTSKKSPILRLAALESLKDIIPRIATNLEIKNIIIKYVSPVNLKSKNPSENLLYMNIFKLLEMTEQATRFSEYCSSDYSKVPELFLSNLKSATNWFVKKQQIDILLDFTLTKAPYTGLHTCIHLCNMLKVSEYESVRNKSGSSILKIMPILSPSERNEVAIELLRGLEIEGQRFTEYIPPFLGLVILWLEPEELDEIIDDLKYKIKTANVDVKILILKAIGTTIANYEVYKERYDETDEIYNNRLKKLLAILLNGIGHYTNKVKQAAITALGRDIFGTSNLSLENKLHIFKLCAKKLITLISNNENDRLLLLTNAAALNHIYRFISDYNFFKGRILIKKPDKVAFFPGTFDPFSLGHKNIAKSIRDLGFEVYLAVDEFSWSKKTLPNLIRKDLINLSICDEFNIYIYPENLQINIANPMDLKTLKESFIGSEVHFVAGSDVLLNASCYKKTPVEHSIHGFKHIIFERGNTKKLQEAKACITGEVLTLNLPQKYSTISSSQIRSYIDKNRDVSMLLDPLVSQYIHEKGFYQREPLDKASFNLNILDFDYLDYIDEVVIKNIFNHTNNNEALKTCLISLKEKESPKIVLIKNSSTKEILALSMIHWVRSNNLYREVQNETTSRELRSTSVGRIIFIDGIYIAHKDKSKLMEQTILTETLAHVIAKDYEYAVFNPNHESLYSSQLIEIMLSQGFKNIGINNYSLPMLAVNMTSPCVLNLDMENILKEPFRSNSKIKNIINQRRKTLENNLANLYPNELLLCVNSEVLHEKMIRNICHENEVSTEIKEPKEYGQTMCVPYGDILDRYVVPNTVTKSLHTEKYYAGDMKTFFIGEAPYYMPLINQMKMIKSFNRPIFLVDNILHKGYRMRALDPLLTEAGINVNKIHCGILSGRGKDLMDIQNRQVTSVYFIPRLKLWFNENALYPFLGGDAIWRGDFPKRNLIPSINSILPYSYPEFIKGVSHDKIYNLSKCCLENSIEILKALEGEYHKLYGRSLTLASLGEVITVPRSPDIGKGIEYDLSSTPSNLVEKDLELLIRLENILQERKL